VQVNSLHAAALFQQASAGNADEATQTQAKQQVAEQFEGVFVSMLLKQLRESLDEGIFGGEKSDTFGAMFDMYLGEHISTGSNLGIRNVVLTQLSSPQQQGIRS
jgi:Rod binding domain-containing protein